jgi:hypothetical protein
MYVTNSIPNTLLIRLIKIQDKEEEEEKTANFESSFIKKEILS